MPPLSNSLTNPSGIPESSSPSNHFNIPPTQTPRKKFSYNEISPNFNFSSTTLSLVQKLGKILGVTLNATKRYIVLQLYIILQKYYPDK